MKVAVVYNRQSKSVINLFGVPNQEKIGLKTIRRVTDALKAGGHQVTALEGDKNLIEKLEEFMPRVVQGERPGIVFNVSYGIQGRARYTHVPAILEMVGIPYVGSSPLAHSLALDKVVSKMIFRQNGLPTPDFAVLSSAGFGVPDLEYPLIVKPRSEAVSFGLKIVNDDEELRVAAQNIFDAFPGDVLVERYITGREVNVGLFGNDPPRAFPAAEIVFGKTGPAVYTYEDKTGRSGRTIEVACPAKIPAKVAARASEIALGAFQALQCHDCARVDMRLDAQGDLWILEVNSLPSLGEHGSYLHGAAVEGLDFAAVVNGLVESAALRAFGTPRPPEAPKGKGDSETRLFSWLTARRDTLERSARDWCLLGRRTSDPVGLQEGMQRLGDRLEDLGMKRRADLSDPRSATTWESRAGLDGGTLLVVPIDVPIPPEAPWAPFHRDPETLFGEGIGISAAPLTAAEFALRALRSVRLLAKSQVGVLAYSDEGRDCRYSGGLIGAAAVRAAQVLVLRPGNPDDTIITRRRGVRKYRLLVEGRARRPGGAGKAPDLLRWTWQRLESCAGLGSSQKRVAVATTEIHSDAPAMMTANRVTATILVSYPNVATADEIEAAVRESFGREGPRWDLDLISDRPPMAERRASTRLVKELTAHARAWNIPIGTESSVLPSAAGLVPASRAVACGLGPIATNLQTPQESVSRISLLQRTLLLARFLAGTVPKK